MTFSDQVQLFARTIRSRWENSPIPITHHELYAWQVAWAPNSSLEALANAAHGMGLIKVDLVEVALPPNGKVARMMVYRPLMVEDIRSTNNETP